MSNFTDKITNKIVLETKNNNPEVIQYGLFIILHNFIGYGILCITAYFLNVLLEAVIITIISSTLRMFSGGVHASTPIGCTILGTIIFILLAKISNHIYPFVDINTIILTIFVITILSISIINKYSFSITHNKPLSEYKHGKKLKKVVLLIIVTLAIFSILVGTFYQEVRLIKKMVIPVYIGMMWHSFTLLPIGKKLFHKLDLMLNKVIKI